MLHTIKGTPLLKLGVPPAGVAPGPGAARGEARPGGAPAAGADATRAERRGVARRQRRAPEREAAGGARERRGAVEREAAGGARERRGAVEREAAGGARERRRAPEREAVGGARERRGAASEREAAGGARERRGAVAEREAAGGARERRGAVAEREAAGGARERRGAVEREAAGGARERRGASEREAAGGARERRDVSDREAAGGARERRGAVDREAAGGVRERRGAVEREAAGGSRERRVSSDREAGRVRPDAPEREAEASVSGRPVAAPARPAARRRPGRARPAAQARAARPATPAAAQPPTARGKRRAGSAARGAAARAPRPAAAPVRAARALPRPSRAPQPARPRPNRRRLTAGEAHWRAWGRRAGRADAALNAIAGAPNHRKALNALWQPHSRALPPGLSASGYNAAAQGYAAGYREASGHGSADWLLLPTERSVAAIVCAMNEEATIAGVLRELQRLPLDELFVIVNGSRDRTLERVRQSSDAIVAYYPDALGHDVGRAIGAKLSSADIVLFVDGDFVVPAEQLVPFIAAVGSGMDVALNNITPYLPAFSRWDQVTTMKRFLNVTMGRPELKANSLTAVPHALSRAAIERIGYRELMVPPKAQVRAMLGGLQIGAPSGVNVIAANKQRGTNRGRLNPVSRLIIGDHAEAIELAMAERGERVAFPDTMRKRTMIRKGEHACR